MAEAVGLVLGVVALISVFQNAIECFDYVRIGQDFGKDHQTPVLRLDLARLRLARWAETIGITGDLTEVREISASIGTDDDVKRAERLLGQIITLFEDARKTSRNVPVLKDDDVLDSEHATLHQKLRHLSSKRQKDTRKRDKVRWALFDAKAFDKLITSVTQLVTGLIEIFPSAKESQLALCKADAQVIQEENATASPLLITAAAQEDPLLATTAVEATKPTQPVYNATFHGSNTSGVQLGFNMATMTNNFGK